MLALTAPALTSVARQVRRVISRRKAIRMPRLRLASHLVRELHFDLLDLVDIILALETYFHISIHDEVPLLTVSDLVDFVLAETQPQRTRPDAGGLPVASGHGNTVSAPRGRGRHGPGFAPDSVI